VTVVISDSLDEGVAVVSGLPSPGDDKVYQLWAIKGGHADSRGLLPTGGGTKLFTGVHGTGVMAISPEPRGGSRQPTGPVTQIPVI
jgi:anti-sigma-K factor RskA